MKLDSYVFKYMAALKKLFSSSSSMDLEDKFVAIRASLLLNRKVRDTIFADMQSFAGAVLASVLLKVPEFNAWVTYSGDFGLSDDSYRHIGDIGYTEKQYATKFLDAKKIIASESQKIDLQNEFIKLVGEANSTSDAELTEIIKLAAYDNGLYSYVTTFEESLTSNNVASSDQNIFKRLIYIFNEATTINIHDECEIISCGINSKSIFFANKLSTVNFSTSGKLVALSSYAFRHTALKSIKLPDSLVFIDQSAFYDNKNLSTIEFGTGFSETYSSIIRDCPGILTLIFNGHYQYTSDINLMDLNSFYYCTSLVEFLFDETNNDALLNYASRAQIRNKGSIANSVTIFGNPNKNSQTNTTPTSQIQNINGFRCLSVGSGLKLVGYDGPDNIDLVFPQGLLEIGDGNATLFANKKFKNILIPKTVEKINPFAFYSASCTSLLVEAGSELTIIGEQSFKNFECVDTMDFSHCIKLDKIGANSFYAIYTLKKIILPDVDYKMSSNAFAYIVAPNVIIDLGNKIQAIPDQCFYSCNMSKISIPLSVATIGNYAFSYCKELTAIYFAPNSPIRYIGYKTFCDCAKLTHIALPDNVEELGNYVFDSTPLKTLYLPDSIKTMGYASLDGTKYSKRLTVYSNSQAVATYCANNNIKYESVD